MKNQKLPLRSFLQELRETGKSILQFVEWGDFKFNYLMAFWSTLEFIRLFKQGEISFKICRRECAAIRQSLWIFVQYN
jgi:hypothetical protein